MLMGMSYSLNITNTAVKSTPLATCFSISLLSSLHHASAANLPRHPLVQPICDEFTQHRLNRVNHLLQHLLVRVFIHIAKNLLLSHHAHRRGEQGGRATLKAQLPEHKKSGEQKLYRRDEIEDRNLEGRGESRARRGDTAWSQPEHERWRMWK